MATARFVSHKVGAILDAEDIMPGENYTLEVSSPGVERKLNKPADYERFTGQKAKIVTTNRLKNRSIGKAYCAVSKTSRSSSNRPKAGSIHIPLAGSETGKPEVRVVISRQPVTENRKRQPEWHRFLSPSRF